MTHHASNRTDPVTGKTINLGGLSFMEYFNYNDPSFDPEHKLLFNSSFGWMGPRFFSTSSAANGSTSTAAAAAVRKGRGPTSTAAIVPARIMVDSGGDKPWGAVTNGCIPGYPCGGDRVFYIQGKDVVSNPAPGTVAWIWNGSSTTDDHI